MQYTFADGFELRKAVKLWFEDTGAAEAKYGQIKNWGTSKVTSMKELFYGKREFNEDLSAWDVSQVTNMNRMFSGCTAFNGKRYAPHHPHIHTHTHARTRSPAGTAWVHASPSSPHPDSLAGDVSAWNVSQVTDMHEMFYGCKAFNGKRYVPHHPHKHTHARSLASRYRLGTCLTLLFPP